MASHLLNIPLFIFEQWTDVTTALSVWTGLRHQLWLVFNNKSLNKSFCGFDYCPTIMKFIIDTAILKLFYMNNLKRKEIKI